jgi:hypothetical protein
MIIAKIDVTKLDKTKFHKGQKGIYADLVLIPNKNGVDQYGYDGFVSQGVSKEDRAAGVKGPIVGNYKEILTQPKQQQPVKPVKEPHDPDDDVPF